MTEDQDDGFIQWDKYKRDILESIDEAIERGNADPGVLYIMKELLDNDVIKVKKKTIEEYFEEQDKLNKK